MTIRTLLLTLGALFLIFVIPSCSKNKTTNFPKPEPESSQKNSENASLSAENQSAIKVKYFYKLPQKVLRTINKSVVSVEISTGLLKDGQMSQNKLLGTGFVVVQNVVFAALHNATNYPAIWNDPEIKCYIYDGENQFKCSLMQAHYGSDLLSLEVQKKEEAVFSKSPVTLADVEINFPEVFYAIMFVPRGPNLYFPARLGPYWLETNFFNEVVRPQTFGVVGGHLTGGFSGSPLIGPNGKVYGMVVETSDTDTIVSKISSIRHAIEEAKELIEKRKKDKK